MIKITALGLVAAALLITPGAFAADKPGEKAGDVACCAGKKACADLDAMNLTADQKTKIEAWQAECMKDGCTKESRRKFFQAAKGILSAEQFTSLKAQCKKSLNKDKEATKTQT
jgi:hypothetical protein